jgi:hypothetical protein
VDPNTQRRQQERYQHQVQAYQEQQARSHQQDEVVHSSGVAGFVVFIVIGVIIWLVVKGASGGAKGGLVARGILLQVSNTRTSSIGTGSTRMEYRQMRVDVEVPGQPPYEVSGNVKYPANLARDVLPGAQVELRVNKRDKNTIEIVGPAVGMSAAAQLTTTSQVRMQ